MNLLLLFKFIFVSHVKQQKLSIFFTLISIILGVSVFVTIRLTSTNILTSFKSSTNYISGQESFIITSVSPIQESLIPELLKLPNVDAIIPVSMRFVKTFSEEKNIGYTPVIGVDIFSLSKIIPTQIALSELNFNSDLFLQDTPVNALVSKKLIPKITSDQLKLWINGIYKTIKIQGIIDKTTAWGDEIIIVDIKNYQNLFQEYFTIDQVHLTFNSTNIKTAITQVAALLPPSLTISQGNENSHYADDITSTYQFNLNFLTCLALLVTAMILYNAISHYVLERRKDFGIMLMLGAQPRHLFLFTLLTTILLAIFCSLGGLVVGYLITTINLNYIVQNFSQLYLPLTITEVHFPISLVFEAIAVVSVVALLVSILPCLEAYKIPALQTTFYQTYEQQFKTKITKFTLLGLAMVLISLFGMMPFFLKFNTNLVYFSLSGILLGTAFFLPIQLNYWLAFLRKIIPTAWIEATMAVNHIKTTSRKNVVAIAAMSITISLYLSCTIVIDSTRYTCTNWVSNVLSADVFINAKPSTFAFMGGYIANEQVDFILKNQDIDAVNFLTHKDIVFNEKALRLIGMEFSVIGNYYKLPLVQPMSQGQLQTLFANPRNILISEHLAHEFNYHIGDTIFIPSNHGLEKLTIANIFYNYANFQNIILMPNSLFKQLYDDPRVESALVYLKQPASYSSFLNAFKEAFPDLNIPLYNQIEIKTIGSNMMDQTFKISKAIILAIFVLTALTLFNVLEQLILSRKHEFTVFWSIGASDYTVIKMCLWESFIIYIAAALGSIIPTLIGLLLIFQFLIPFLFGVHLDLVFSYLSLISFFILLSGLVILDGLLPAVKIKKFINAKGLRYE